MPRTVSSSISQIRCKHTNYGCLVLWNSKCKTKKIKTKQQCNNVQPISGLLLSVTVLPI